MFVTLEFREAIGTLEFRKVFGSTRSGTLEFTEVMGSAKFTESDSFACSFSVDSIELAKADWHF